MAGTSDGRRIRKTEKLNKLWITKSKRNRFAKIVVSENIIIV